MPASTATGSARPSLVELLGSTAACRAHTLPCHSEPSAAAQRRGRGRNLLFPASSAEPTNDSYQGTSSLVPQSHQKPRASAPEVEQPVWDGHSLSVAVGFELRMIQNVWRGRPRPRKALGKGTSSTRAATTLETIALQRLRHLPPIRACCRDNEPPVSATVLRNGSVKLLIAAKGKLHERGEERTYHKGRVYDHDSVQILGGPEGKPACAAVVCCVTLRCGSILFGPEPRRRYPQMDGDK
jgi:hypothetical protein